MLRALIVLLVMFLLGRLLRQLVRGGAAHSSAGGPEVEHMLRCARCGTFVPERDAVSADGRHYCSDGHRALGPAEPS